MSNDKRPSPTVDLGHPTEPHGVIPAFHSIEEEAAFWDAHDFTDFSELVEEDVDQDKTFVVPAAGADQGEAFPVRLSPGDREELGRRADALGVEPADLAHMWVDRGTPPQGSIVGRRRWHHPCYTS